MEKPLWVPSQERIDRANLSRFIKFVQSECDVVIDKYVDLYDFSIRYPEKFWTAVWDFCGIRANGERTPVLFDADRMPGARWFPKVQLNFAQNLMRYRDERIALQFRNESGHQEEVSYNELHDRVSRMQQALKASGVEMGDRVAGFVPNIPDAVVAMLATASLGAIWSSCSPDFGINGIVDRFGQITPKVLFATYSYVYGGKTFDCLERISSIVEKIPSIKRVVLLPYLHNAAIASSVPKSVSLQDWIAPYASEPVTFDLTPFDHPLYIMYSSGTTGVPKCIVHGAGGTLIQHLKEHVLHVDLKREDRIFFYTTCGWMMWNWLVSALAVGSTLVLYDGSPSYPDGNKLWDLADDLGISVFGTSAKWLSAIEKSGIKPRETHKLLQLKTILSTGSPLAPESFDYVYRDIKQRVMLSSISGGTDIISCFALGNPMLPVWRGELQCRGLGLKVEVLNEDGLPVREQAGELACLAPFPCMPIGFWNDPNNDKYKAAYFEHIPGIWCHGDYAVLTTHDGLIIQGRSDAVLNPGGVRIGTAEIYRQVERMPEVIESLCIGQDWNQDVRVVLFVRLRDGITLDDALHDKIKREIREHTTPRHVPSKIIAVPDIPRTISGKITELAVRHLIHGRPVKNTDALANPQSLDFYRDLAELKT
jgi:acetoacetyl-CoA synthetase